MPGTLPHTQNGFAQTTAEQYSRAQHDDEPEIAAADPTTLKFDGKVSIADDDAGSEPVQPNGPLPPSRALKVES